MRNGISGNADNIQYERLSSYFALKVWALACSFLLSTTSYAAEISINASQNPDNTIQLSGELAASVEYTANGLKIEIPGVNIKLTCNGTDVSEEACTLDLAQGGGGSTGGDGSTGDGSSTDGDKTQDEKFCEAGRDAPFTNPSVWDATCNPDGTVKDPSKGDENPDGGFGTGGGFTGNGKEDDTCGANGFDPNCSDPSDNASDLVTESREAFGNDPRVIWDRTIPQNDRFKENFGRTLAAFDFGSAGEQGRGTAEKFIVPKGEIAVVGFTVGGDEFAKDESGNLTNERIDPTRMRLSYAPGTTAAEGFLHIWISETKDGERISEECSRSGYGEGKFLVSVDGHYECNVEREKVYYLMAAYCNPEDDYNCSSDKAVTGLRNGQVVFDTTWWRPNS